MCYKVLLYRKVCELQILRIIGHCTTSGAHGALQSPTTKCNALLVHFVLGRMHNVYSVHSVYSVSTQWAAK